MLDYSKYCSWWGTCLWISIRGSGDCVWSARCRCVHFANDRVARSNPVNDVRKQERQIEHVVGLGGLIWSSGEENEENTNCSWRAKEGPFARGNNRSTWIISQELLVAQVLEFVDYRLLVILRFSIVMRHMCITCEESSQYQAIWSSRQTSMCQQVYFEAELLRNEQQNSKIRFVKVAFVWYASNTPQMSLNQEGRRSSGLGALMARYAIRVLVRLRVKVRVRFRVKVRVRDRGRLQ